MLHMSWNLRWSCLPAWRRVLKKMRCEKKKKKKMRCGRKQKWGSLWQITCVGPWLGLATFGWGFWNPTPQSAALCWDIRKGGIFMWFNQQNTGNVGDWKSCPCCDSVGPEKCERKLGHQNDVRVWHGFCWPGRAIISEMWITTETCVWMVTWKSLTYP